MVKTDSAVYRETKYIAVFCAVLSVLMQAVFVAIKRWDYTVLLGNLLSLFAAVANFYLMGVSLEKALSSEKREAEKIMRASQSFRNIGIFIAVAIGVVLPYFNTVATILPVFFPRVAVAFRPLFKEKEVIDR